MAFRTLISTDALATRLADPNFVVVDCRFKLDDVAWGEREWKAAHIPGAVYAHLDRDLSGPKTGTNGRHPLPDTAVLARTFGRLGITGGKQVVAYDSDSGVFASRLWWLLRWLGHDGVAVLDGGYAKWVAEGRPVSVEAAPLDSAEFHASPRQDMAIGIEDVSAHARDANWRLLDARAPERYRGEVEPMDPVAGHIPGASQLLFPAEHRRTRQTPHAGRSACAIWPLHQGHRARAHRLLLRIRSTGVPQPARPRACWRVRSQALSGIVESVGKRSIEAGRNGGRVRTRRLFVVHSMRGPRNR